MDRGEPVFGRERRNYLNDLAELQGTAIQFNGKSIQELIGIRDVRYGIIEKDRNEYAIVLVADSVNYDLLSESGKRSTILGYEQLFKVLSFPVQIIIQAVRQDHRKEIRRFEEEAAKYGEEVKNYVNGIVDYIKNVTWEETRIVKRVYYVISYRYEEAPHYQLKSEDKIARIFQELSTRAIQVKNMLKKAQIKSRVLGSLEAVEVVRRALNRDRTLIAPIEDVEQRSMLSQFITADPESLPQMDELWKQWEDEMLGQGGQPDEKMAAS